MSNCVDAIVDNTRYAQPGHRPPAGPGQVRGEGTGGAPVHTEPGSAGSTLTALMQRIDLNSDLGEGASNDAAIMPFITSANVACGGHAGDERTMRETIGLALRHGAGVGAHPGYPDRENFGRVPQRLDHTTLVAELHRQLGALDDVARQLGAEVTHVKPHGALYNQAERDADVAGSIVTAVRSWRAQATVFASPGSALERAARDAGLRVALEGFADRAYEPDGTLRSRLLPGAVLSDPALAAAQAVSIVREGGVRASDGTFIALAVDTLCLHGDGPEAAVIAMEVRSRLDAAGISVERFGS